MNFFITFLFNIHIINAELLIKQSNIQHSMVKLIQNTDITGIIKQII